MRKYYIGDPCYDDSYSELEQNRYTDEGSYAGILEVNVENFEDVTMEWDDVNDVYLINVPKGATVQYNGEKYEFEGTRRERIGKLYVDSGCAGIFYEQPTEEEYRKHCYTKNWGWDTTKGYRVENGIGDGEYKLVLNWV